MFVHRSCFSKWLSASPDFITCPVCKDTYNPSFLVPFVGVEALMNYKENRDEEEDEEEEDQYEWELNVPGLPPTIYQDEEGILYFDTVNQLNNYMENEKRNILSFKKKKFQYKSHFYQKHSRRPSFSKVRM